MVSSAYLRLLIFLLAMLIPACDSSSSVFCMMYSSYKLNKQGDNIQPCQFWTPFPSLNESVVPCKVQSVVAWLAYRFFRRRVRCSGILISLKISHSWLSWYRICLQCGRPGFDPWVGKIPWRRERLPTLVFWPGEFHGLHSPWICRVRHDWTTFTVCLDPHSQRL